MAHAIYEKHPRELLQECWSDADTKLYPVLKRCGRKALLLEQYEQLNAVLELPVAEIVMQTKILNPVRIAFFFKTLDLDPLVAAASRMLSYNITAAKNFDTMLRHMRKLNLVGDHCTEAKALRHGAYRSVTDYVEARLISAKAPVILKLSSGLRQITSGKMINDIAIKWQNCLRAPAYKIALGLGTKVFLLMDSNEFGDAIALASFERTAFGWHMDECELPPRVPAPDEMRQRFVELLARDGIAADVRTFAKALSELDPCPEPSSGDEAWDWQHKDAE